VAVDRAWAKALAGVEILTAGEALETLAALDQIAERAASDAAWLEASEAEDVHHFVELALVEKLGGLGHKLHTGRSRNELVATEFRLFIKNASGEMRAGVAGLIAALLEQAENCFGVPMPGATHLQPAQPILFSHFLQGMWRPVRPSRPAGRSGGERRRVSHGLRRAGRLRLPGEPRGHRARVGLLPSHTEQRACGQPARFLRLIISTL